MFDKERFVEELRAAVRESEAQNAVAEVLERAVADPSAMLAALGPPGKGRSEQLFVDDTLTVSNVIWPNSGCWIRAIRHSTN